MYKTPNHFLSSAEPWPSSWKVISISSSVAAIAVGAAATAAVTVVVDVHSAIVAISDASMVVAAIHLVSFERGL